MRTLNNQTLPDKTSKPGSYPIIDVKNTITCSNEYNNITFLNQDNIAIASENITFKIPPEEIVTTSTDPCAEPEGKWFESIGKRPVTWRALTLAPNGPGYNLIWRGTPAYQYFYVRVPYGWDSQTEFGVVFGSPTWDWGFESPWSMLEGAWTAYEAYFPGSGSWGGLNSYRWRYTNADGLALMEYSNSGYWNEVFRIGKLSDWQCSGATPYKDNAEQVPCTFLITPQDYACGSYAVLNSSPFGGGTISREVPIDIQLSSEIPWNSYAGSSEGGLINDVPIVLECDSGLRKTGFILRRNMAGGSYWEWKLTGGRYNTYVGTCEIASNWQPWSHHDMNDRTQSLWYPSSDNNCCLGEKPSLCPPGVKEISGSAIVGPALLTYKWEVLSDTSISLTIYEGAVYYFPTFNITNINYITFEQSLNFGVSRPATRTLLVNTYGNGYFKITNGGLPTIYYCRNNGEINLYESSFYPWFV